MEEARRIEELQRARELASQALAQAQQVSLAQQASLALGSEESSVGSMVALEEMEVDEAILHTAECMSPGALI